MKIAAIVGNHYDYLTETVLEGLELLGHEIVCDNPILRTRDLIPRTCLKSKEFLDYTKEAQLLITFWSHPADPPNYNLAIAANCWYKNVFVDGGDFYWEINDYFRKRCLLYFKREILKTSTDQDLIPLNFAIEQRYYFPKIEKDIDLVCLYDKQGMNLERERVINWVEKLPIKMKIIGAIRDIGANLTNVWTKGRHCIDYYKILAKTRICVSVKGGGFDCARFWESIANNCYVLTTPIEIKYEARNSSHTTFTNEIYLKTITNQLLEQSSLCLTELVERDKRRNTTLERAKYFLAKIHEKNPTITD